MRAGIFSLRIKELSSYDARKTQLWSEQSVLQPLTSASFETYTYCAFRYNTPSPPKGWVKDWFPGALTVIVPVDTTLRVLGLNHSNAYVAGTRLTVNEELDPGSYTRYSTPGLARQ
jgi:hypothetical protein